MKKNMKKWGSLLLACAVMVLPAANAFAADPSTEPEILQDMQDDLSADPSTEPEILQDMQDEMSDDQPSEPPTDQPSEPAAPGTADQAQAGAAEPSTDTETEPTITDKAPADNAADPSTDPEAVDAAGQQGEVTEPITKEDKPYLALGANLTAEQQAAVLGLLGINPAELGDYDVIYITNEEEHQYLGNYVSASVIPAVIKAFLYMPMVQ